MRLESHLGKDADENGPFAGLILYEPLKQEGGFDSYVKYSNDVPYGSPAKLVERIGQEPIQDGGMGGYGGGLRSFGTDASKEASTGRGKSASASGRVTTSLSGTLVFHLMQSPREQTAVHQSLRLLLRPHRWTFFCEKGQSANLGRDERTRICKSLRMRCALRSSSPRLWAARRR